MSTETTTPSEHTHDHVVMRFPHPGRLLRAFLPEEAVKHLYAARREQLLAVRSIVDAAIDRVDKAEQHRAQRTD
jgi:hypothetical protein